ncbi:MAG: outer membrane lipoprotein carrier protein LolA [Bacteroidetes bacterium]|nr:outer membrane lipoprotein carrier protein LolA [Bacteroidota bacterium]
MKLFLSIAMLAFFSFPAFSQNNSLGKNDPEAKTILDKVSAKFKTYKSVTASFTLKVENAAGKIIGTKSGVVNMKGSQYRVTISGQDIFSDGNNIWTVDKSANEVQITKFDAAANTLTPQKMFTNFYDKDFLYKLNGESKISGKTIQEIELTPVDKTKTFFKVIVGIDKNTRNIVSTKVYEKNGNKYTYSVTSMKTNADLPQSMFVFDQKKYPKIEVVDLR